MNYQYAVSERADNENFSIPVHLKNQDKDWFAEFYYHLASLGTNHQHQAIQDKPHVILSFII